MSEYTDNQRFAAEAERRAAEQEERIRQNVERLNADMLARQREQREAGRDLRRGAP